MASLQKLERDALDDEEEGEIREDYEDEEIGVQEREEGEASEDEVEDNRRHVALGSLEASVVDKRQSKSVDMGSESSQDEEDELRNDGDAELMSQQKFASLAALDNRPITQVSVEELEEGEIATSGDSPFEAQLSESSAQEQEEGEEEQAVQRATKRKRSARQPRRRPLEKLGTSGVNVTEKLAMSGVPVGEKRVPPQHQLPQPQLPPGYDNDRPFYQAERQLLETDRQIWRGIDGNDGPPEARYWRSSQYGPPTKKRQILEQPSILGRPPDSFPLMQPRMLPKHSKIAGFMEQDVLKEPLKEIAKSMARVGSSQMVMVTGRMPESVQKKCKLVLQKLKGSLDKDGRPIPAIFELPKRSEAPDYFKIVADPIDMRTIEQHLDRFDYGSVLDFAADVQLMLDNAARYYNSIEVKGNARRLQALYFQRMHHNFPDIDFSCVKTRTLATLNLSPAVPASQQQQSVQGKAQVPAQTQAEGTATSFLMARHTTKAIETSEAEKVAKKSHKKSKMKMAHKTPVKAKVNLEDRKSTVVDGCEQFRHPLDLVFCKRKRKERGRPMGKIKSVANTGNILATGNSKVTREANRETINNNRVVVKCVGTKVKTAGIGSGIINTGGGSLKPGVSPRGGPLQRFPEKGHVGLNRGPGVVAAAAPAPLGPDQWLTPVKRMRTDTGKRRPSHH